MSLTAENLTCIRGDHLVFSDLDFELQPSRALWVTGPNGAGKSTLLRAVAGLLNISDGQLIWQGEDITRNPDKFEKSSHYVGHLDSLKTAFTVRENLTFWAHFGGGGDVARALDSLDLTALADLPAGILSAGQKRRCNIARLLLQDRPLWILDEPTNALDSHYSALFTSRMEAHLEGGGMILFASHFDLGLRATSRLEIAGTERI